MTRVMATVKLSLLKFKHKSGDIMFCQQCEKMAKQETAAKNLLSSISGFDLSIICV